LITPGYRHILSIVSATALSFDFLSRPAPPPPSALSHPPSAVRDDVRRLRESLTATVAAKVMNATELIRALDKARREESIPTTLAPFDTLLGGGLPRGKMVELTGRRATGRFAIAMSALAAATSMGEAAVLVDLGDHFDPQVAEETGVDLRRMLWIRPKTLKQAVMSVEMIAATGFQLVVLDVGLHPIRGRRVADAAWVRLARTAEAQGTAMMISTPYPLTGTASEAVVKLEHARAQWLGKGNAPRVLAGTAVALRLEKHRHMKPGTKASLALAVLP
jgi:recA bacterial DNA recombination protein